MQDLKVGQPAFTRLPLWAWIGCCLTLLLLAIQEPFDIRSPDAAFHMAKIQRRQGMPFVHPFSGTVTAYPAMFHVIFGNLNRLLGLDSYVLQHLIAILQFSLLVLGFYYLARPVVRSVPVLACSVLALSLVVYAPTGRYIVLTEPGNLSLGILFFGLGMLIRYQLSGQRLFLAGGAMLLGLATAIWWVHLFAAPVFLLLLGTRPSASKPRRVVGELAIAGACFALPMLAVVWQIWAIRGVLPDYQSAPQRLDIPIAAWTWFISLTTKGNTQFFHYLWPLDQIGSFHDNPAMGIFRIVRSLFLSAQFFLVIIPFNIFLIIAAIRYVRGPCKAAQDDHARLVRRLLLAGVVVVLSSMLASLMGGADLGKMRRCQFIIWVVLLAVGMQGAWPAGPDARGRRAFQWLFWIAWAFMLLTVTHSPRLVTSGHAVALSTENQAVVRFITGLPDHQHQRLFFCFENLREISPHVSFCGFIGHPAPRYYHQDPVSSKRLFEAYTLIAGMSPEWQEVARACGVRYMVLSKEDKTNVPLLAFYRPLGRTVLENRKWVVLDFEGRLDEVLTMPASSGSDT